MHQLSIKSTSKAGLQSVGEPVRSHNFLTSFASANLIFEFTGLSSLCLSNKKGRLFLYLSIASCCKLPTNALPRLRSLKQALRRNGIPKHVCAGLHCVGVPVCHHACRSIYKPGLQHQARPMGSRHLLAITTYTNLIWPDVVSCRHYAESLNTPLP